MRIKYDDLVPPFRNKIGGQDFMANHYGFTMRNKPKIRNWRSPDQLSMKKFLMWNDRHWRNLSSAERAAWNSWALFLPQPTHKDAASYLSGYHCFSRRNFYQMLQSYPPFSPMASPVFVEYFEDSFTATVTRSGDSLLVDFDFDRGNSDLNCFVFVSPVSFPSWYWWCSRVRYMGNLVNADGQLDITDLYLASYGQLPEEDQTLFVSMVQAGSDQGQLFFVNAQKITVQGGTQPVTLGWLYNYRALEDVRGIGNSGFVFPNFSHWYNLRTFLGGAGAGGSMKENTFDWWNAPNTGATNSSGFTARGGGWREASVGSFGFLKHRGAYWCFKYAGGSQGYEFYLLSNSATLSYYAFRGFRQGLSARLCNPSTVNPEGSMNVYVGNDGRSYQTKVYNGIEWMLENLAETEFANGDPIPLVVDNATWITTNSAARCAFDNDQSFVPV